MASKHVSLSSSKKVKPGMTFTTELPRKVILLRNRIPALTVARNADYADAPRVTCLSDHTISKISRCPIDIWRSSLQCPAQVVVRCQAHLPLSETSIENIGWRSIRAGTAAEMATTSTYAFARLKRNWHFPSNVDRSSTGPTAKSCSSDTRQGEDVASNMHQSKSGREQV